MNLFSAISISSSGLAADRLRINVLSSNLANINSTRSEDGGPYRKRDVIVRSEPITSPFDDLLSRKLKRNISSVKIDNIVLDQRDPKRVFRPDHPDADKDGYVHLPNINVMEEMSNLIETSRNYEANITAINVTKGMLLKALDIGGQ